MIALDETISVARSAAACYRYLIDFSTCEQWDPAVYRALKITPGKPCVDSEFDVTVTLLGRRRTLRYRIEALHTDSLIELSAHADGFRSRERIVIKPLGTERAQIDWHAQFVFNDMPRSAQRVARPLFVRMGRKAVAGLKRALTIDSHPPAQSWISYAVDRSVVAAAPAFTERGYLALDDKSHSEYMDGRVAVVTGASSGIGLAAACEYARLGASVALVARDTDRLASAARTVCDFAGCETDAVACFDADLLSVAATKALAARITAAYPRIDVLLNNAGALFAEHATTIDGFERTVAINLVAPYVLTEALLGVLESGAGRVINISSGGMYLQALDLADMNYEHSPFDGSKAYARAKRALVALSCHWARRYQATGVRFNAMHPGWVATPGVTQSLPGFNRVMGRYLRDARMGADTAVWLGAATAAASCNGAFLFDRQPHPTAVIPNTRVLPSQAQSLYAWLRNTTGVASRGR